MSDVTRAFDGCFALPPNEENTRLVRKNMHEVTTTARRLKQTIPVNARWLREGDERTTEDNACGITSEDVMSTEQTYERPMFRRCG